MKNKILLSVLFVASMNAIILTDEEKTVTNQTTSLDASVASVENINERIEIGQEAIVEPAALVVTADNDLNVPAVAQQPTTNAESVSIVPTENNSASMYTQPSQEQPENSSSSMSVAKSDNNSNAVAAISEEPKANVVTNISTKPVVHANDHNSNTPESVSSKKVVLVQGNNEKENKGIFAEIGTYYGSLANSVDNFFARCPGSSYVSNAVDFAREHVKMTLFLTAAVTVLVVKSLENKDVIDEE